MVRLSHSPPSRLSSDEASCANHCPFVNRHDRRCEQFLSLNRLSHAFDYCFGQYRACSYYTEQLNERRVRRGAAIEHATGDPLVQLTIHREVLDRARGSRAIAA